MNGPSKVFRICSRCMELEDYRNGVPILGSAWFTLVQYNRKNKQLIKKLEKGELV
jgi:endo-beta-N-acetylglucosaminidase D